MKAHAKQTINVAINGASGNIAYSLIPLFCNGTVFGPNVKINLRLLDIPMAESKLRGTMMEVEDGAYKLLEDVSVHFDVKKGLKDVDCCVFIASYPHYSGMERSHLLKKNVEIYSQIGQTMNEVADPDCKVVVVANPVNSLTTILAKHAPKIPAKNFTGLSRLDHNRAKWLLAKTCNAELNQIRDLVVWGNHSDTQYPDVSHVKVGRTHIKEILGDKEEWLHTDYVKYCVSRWKKVFDARGVTRYRLFNYLV
jgi:malate dehydrogenase